MFYLIIMHFNGNSFFFACVWLGLVIDKKKSKNLEGKEEQLEM